MDIRLLRQNRAKSVKFWLGIFVGILFLYLAVRGTDFSEIFSVIRQAYVLPIVISLALRFIALWIRGLRWRTILKPIKLIPSFLLFRILCIGELGNYLLPARIGEIIRVMMISMKEQISKASTFASVFVEKLVDLSMVLFFLVSFSVAFSLPSLVQVSSYIAGSVLFVVIVACILLLHFKSKIEKLVELLLSKFPKAVITIQRLIDRFFEGLSIIKNIRQLLPAFFWSLILWILYSLALFFVFLALNIELPWYASFITAAAVGLGQSVPSTAGYIGTNEFFAVAILTTFSLDKSVALACAILSHGLQYVTVIILGLYSYLVENSKANQAEELRSSVDLENQQIV